MVEANLGGAIFVYITKESVFFLMMLRFFADRLSPGNRTPLMLAAKGGHLRFAAWTVCLQGAEILLKVGSVEGRMKS